jgi:hypothetical protein
LLIVRTSDLFLATVERTRSKNNDNKTTKKWIAQSKGSWIDEDKDR